MLKLDRVLKQIKEEIIEGRHGVAGDRFMTVRKLGERFGVSLTTAQKAVQRLKQEGLLVGDSTNPALLGPEVGRGEDAETQPGSFPNRLGLIVTDITNPFFSRLCRDIQLAAIELDYQLVMGSSGSDFAREERVVRGFLDIGVDGLLICPGLDDACAKLYAELVEQGIPLVFVSRRVEGIDADFVVAHNFVGGAMMAGHLLSVGYESFGYIGFGPRLKNDNRLRGFRLALSEQDAVLPNEWIADGNGRGIVHGYQAMAHLVSGPERPRAVFAYNDLLAIGAMQYCREQGLSVPGEVAIAGFDNLPESEVTSPPLTTVAYPIRSIARLAVQSLVDRVRRGEAHPASHVLLEPHLVIRRSTDPEANTLQTADTDEIPADEVSHSRSSGGKTAATMPSNPD
ncbi:MAG: substrate-binding domain-containing protein [Thermoguttaceae bacterium]|jgi:LacI family transcriptional regulator|nr:substrate-binding domain-containing protein [Thermoguttaceae bacterium]